MRNLKGEEKDVESNHSINLNIYENSDVFTNLYLRRTEENSYSIYFLGKNGEEKSNKVVRVTLYYTHAAHEKTFDLKTD